MLSEHQHSSLTFDSPINQVALASPEAFMAIARVRANIRRTSEQPSQQQKTATGASTLSTLIPSTDVSRNIKISLPTATQQTTSGRVDVISPNKVEPWHSSGITQTAAGGTPVAHGKPTEAHKQDVPDVSQPQSAKQQPSPALDPMAHLRALQASGLLGKDMIDMLDNAIRTSLQAEATKKPTTASGPTVTISNDAIDPQGPSRPVIYTQTELKALRPKAESQPLPKLSHTAAQTSDTTNEAKKASNPFTARTIPLQQAGTGNNSRGLAQRLADQRKALIGEHIHRTRFQPPLHLLIEGFKNLSLHDDTNTESATGVSDTTSTKASKATENPFGSPEPKTPIPSHIRNVASDTGYGATMRSQYGVDKPLGAPKPRGSGPELPQHLRNVVPAADHGAAVRRQYGIPDFAAPETKSRTNPMSVLKASETSPQPRRRSGVAANSNPMARPAASTKPGPPLPAFLRGQTAGDAGAAARAQYGGQVLPSSTNNQTFTSTRPTEERPVTSRPQLPTHLSGQTATDLGAAIRAQYGGNVPGSFANYNNTFSTRPKEDRPATSKPQLPAHLRGQTAEDLGAAVRAQ